MKGNVDVALNVTKFNHQFCSRVQNYLYFFIICCHDLFKTEGKVFLALLQNILSFAHITQHKWLQQNPSETVFDREQNCLSSIEVDDQRKGKTLNARKLNDTKSGAVGRDA